MKLIESKISIKRCYRSVCDFFDLSGQFDFFKIIINTLSLSEVLKERDAQVQQKKQLKLVQSKRESLFTEANNKNYALQASGEEQMKLKSKTQTLEVAAYQKQQRKAKNEEIKHEIIEDIQQGQAYRRADEEYMVWLLEKHAKEREEKRDVNKKIINQIAQKKRLQEGFGKWKRMGKRVFI